MARREASQSVANCSLVFLLCSSCAALARLLFILSPSQGLGKGPDTAEGALNGLGISFPVN